MSPKTSRITLSAAIMASVVLAWYFLSSSQNDDTEQTQTRSEQKSGNNQSSALESVESPAPTSKFPPHLQSEQTVSLEEIASLSSANETTLLFQRISIELINELKLLETTTDSNKIRSKLTPIVSKFYYLNRASAAELRKPQERLPDFFQEDIVHLEELWTTNQALARTADNIFSKFGLLAYEHIPYQLREELTLQ